MDITIVIPAYNESRKIARDIKAACEFAVENNLNAEIIVIDDGSTDNTYENAVVCKTPETVKLFVIKLPQNRGKGYAVRKGIEKSAGEYVMFADSGCCVPYQNTIKAIELLKNDICDIAHGSRKMPGCKIKIPQPWHRQIFSKLFRYCVLLLMRIPAEFTDTQCGFKVYKGNIARQLYEKCTVDGFMFDIEVISRALKQQYRIKEFPVTWTCDLDSRLAPHRSFHTLLLELIKIKIALMKHARS
jgi:hypothetical protein